jgi:ornithine decarboxylase
MRSRPIPSPDLLRILWDSGVTHYDVASVAEVRLVAETLPGATICFMHPVKAEEAIARSLFRARRPHLLARHDRGARQDRAHHQECARSQPVRAHPGVLGSFQAQPRFQIRRDPLEMKELLFAARQAADALGICFTSAARR